MGWKSTIDITRKEAEELIFKRLASLSEINDEDLSYILESFGYGEDTELSYYGHNFSIVEKLEDN